MWEQYIGGKCIDREVSKYSWLTGYRNNIVNASEERHCKCKKLGLRSNLGRV